MGLPAAQAHAMPGGVAARLPEAVHADTRHEHHTAPGHLLFDSCQVLLSPALLLLLPLMFMSRASAAQTATSPLVHP